MRFSYSTPTKISRGLNHIWYSKMGGKPSSSMIIEDADRDLEALEIVFRVNGAEVEGLADRNEHIPK